MEKLTGIFSKIIACLVFFSFAVILGIIIILDRSHLDWFNYRIAIRNVFLLVGWAVVFGFIFAFRGKLKPWAKKSGSLLQWKKTLLFCSVILFIVEIIIVKAIHFQVGWDVYYMKDMAQQFLQGGLSSFYKDYMVTNPNNIFIFGLNVFFLWLGNLIHVDGYILFIIFGVLCTNISCYLVGVVTYRMTKKMLPAWIAYGIAVVLLGLSPWMSVPYTDTISLWISVLSIDIYFILKERMAHPAWMALLIFALGGITYYLKPINIFVGLSILIVEIIHFTKEKFQLKKILVCILVAVVSLFCVKGFQQLVWTGLDYTPDSRYEKPMVYYLMLGNDPLLGGVYNTVDDDYISGFYSLEEKKEASLSLLKTRMSQMGVSGYLSLLVRKMDVDFNSGLFGWGKEADFVYELYDTDSGFDHSIRNIYYVGQGSGVYSWLDQKELCFLEDGKNFQFLAVVTQGVWLFVLMMCLLFGIYGWKKTSKNPVEDVISVAVLGMILYLVLFETNARYLISMLPVFFVMAGVGCSKMIEKIVGE